ARHRDGGDRSCSADRALGAGGGTYWDGDRDRASAFRRGPWKALSSGALGRAFTRAAPRGARETVNAYVDSSIVLRVVLGESGTLPAWRRLRRAIASQIVRIECLRTIDRARIRLGLDDENVAERRAAVLDVLEGVDMVPLDAAVL